MTILTLVDNRELDRYPTLMCFATLQDAEDMKKSFNTDAKFWNIKPIELIGE
jgi:hypothetical protein